MPIFGRYPLLTGQSFRKLLWSDKHYLLPNFYYSPVVSDVLFVWIWKVNILAQRRRKSLPHFFPLPEKSWASAFAGAHDSFYPPENIYPPDRYSIRRLQTSQPKNQKIISPFRSEVYPPQVWVTRRSIWRRKPSI